MNMSRPSLAILLCSLLLPQCAGATAWQAFLSNPSEVNYERVKAESRQTPCKPFATVSSVGRRGIASEIEKGNGLMLRASTMIAECLSSHELEALLVSIGAFVENSPRDFLLAVRDLKISGARLENMLTALPEATVDDFDARIALVNARLSALQKVSNPELASTKALAVEVLTRSRARLEQARADCKAAGNC